MQVTKQKLELDMEQWTDSTLGKEYKSVYCHPAYLMYMQITSWEMPSWMKHKPGIKIAGGSINNLSMQMTPPFMAESKEALKSLLMKAKEQSEKAGLKFSIQEMKIMASSPIASWQIYGRKSGNSDSFIFLGS